MPTLTAPQIEPSVFCKGCPLYEDRNEIARGLDIIFAPEHHSLSPWDCVFGLNGGGRDIFGVWDFEECYKSCEKKHLKRNEYERQRSNIYYHTVAKWKRQK